MLLRPDNGKLGKIACWYLPAGSTCPCQTTVCASCCYASRGNFVGPNAKKAHRRNYRASKRANFAAKMIAEINHKELTLLRLHSGGDFYDVEYIDKWLEIVQACPATTFYTYTRSWRDAEMLVALRRLAAQPNVHLWWSTDAETESIDGRPPAVDGVRVAHLILDDSEFDSVPDHADLVFRNKRSTKKTRVNGVLVCPCENGVKTTPRMHCDRCMVCYRTRATKRAGTESVTV